MGDDGNIRLLSHIKKNYVAGVCGVSECTVRHWRRTDSYPEYAVKLVAMDGGFLLFRGWQGWQIRPDGLLYAPGYRDGFKPGDITSITYLRQRCDELERRNAAPAQYLLDC